MKFRLPYESHDSPFTPSGETTRPVYKLVNKHGERSLVKVDEIDIPSSIASYLDQTDLKAMLKRYSLTGDFSILSKGGSYVYEDVSGCETDYARLISSTREIALLKLQNFENVQKMSENGKAVEGSEVRSAADPGTFDSKIDNVEVKHE